MTKQDTLAVRSGLAACVSVGDVSDSDRFESLGEWAADPMAPDEPDDGIVVTTRRRLLRVSILAAEVGARFAREGIECDPSAWMLTPRRAFDGGRPIDACQGLREFERGILLHGLALGLDLDADTLDGLLSEGDESTCGTADRRPATVH